MTAVKIEMNSDTYYIGDTYTQDRYGRQSNGKPSLTRSILLAKRFNSIYELINILKVLDKINIKYQVIRMEE